jgi:hypothetical protein
MQIFLLWNDSAANRIVKFAVDYSIDRNRLNVFDIRPVEVSLLDLQWHTVVTRMKVRSEKTYQLLRGRFLDSGSLDQLVDEIARRHQLSIIA